MPTLKEAFSREHRAKLLREEQDRQRQLEQEREDRKEHAEQAKRLSNSLDRFSEQLGAFALALTTLAERQASMERDQEYIRNSMLIIADRMKLDGLQKLITKEQETK